VTLLIAGCASAPAITEVINETPAGYIVQVDDANGSRYFASPPGASVVVDAEGAYDPPPTDMYLYNELCVLVVDVASPPYSGGGVIRIVGDGTIQFEHGRQPAGDVDSSGLIGHPGCDAAAAELRQ